MPFKTLILIFVCVFCLISPSPLPAAESADQGDILNAAESVFQNMSKAAYPALWSGLTVASQKSIIRNVRKSLGKAGLDYGEELIRADFEKGGEIARGYWSGYLAEFDPKSILDESKWSMGEMKKDRAEIVIRHKKSEHDAILKMFREVGIWKVGLEESFSTRRQ